MKITNFKLVDYLNQPSELINEYAVALRYIKPKPTKKEVFHMKLKHVDFIKRNLYSKNDVDLLGIVSRVQKISKSKVLDMEIIDFFGIINSIKEQMNTILSAEETSLTPAEVNVKWEMVNGSERMSIFGIYNTLESLSGRDALKYKKYMNMNYSEVFTILYMRKTAAELAAEMDKIKTK